MRETVYEGKYYQEPDYETQEAVAAGGINVFRYYPKDRLVIVAEVTAKKFACERFYPNMPQSFAEDVVYEEDRSVFYAMYQAIDQGDKKATAVFRLRDGEIFARVVLTVLEADEHGDAQVVIGMVEDVTEEITKEEANRIREAASRTRELALYESQARLESINRALSSNFNNVYLADLETGSIRSYDMSDVIRREYGTLFEEGDYSSLIQFYIQKSVYEPDRVLFEEIIDTEHLRDTVRAKGSRTFNYRIVRDGEIQYFQCRAVKVQIENRDFCVIAFRDVNAEIVRENEQKAQIRQYEQLFVVTAASIYAGILQIELNTGSTKRIMMQDKRIDVEDMGSWDAYLDSQITFVHPDDVPAMTEALSISTLRSMQVNEKSVFSYKSSTKSETGKYKSFFTTTHIIENGGRRYGVIVTIDNTNAVEQELKQKELIEDALARAEAANRAKTTFLSNMSHDIRTPMNAIIGFTTLATTHIDKKDQVKDYLGKIMSASNHLLSLINDILDMSRIESGRMQLEEVECSLAEIMHAVRNIMQADVKSKRLNFYIDTVDVFNEKVICDKLRLNQILLNLLGNAVKFTEPGGSISVRICQKPAEMAGYGKYEFHVKDTGIGMSESFLKNIFEPFERERTSTVSGIQGTGLGMPITKSIVEMMGGTIEVTSRQGVGSEFIVTIPLKKLAKEEVEVRVKEMEGLHALVVDDDFDTCDSVSNMLIQIGMRAEWTMSGREAILRTRQALNRNDEYRVYVIDWLVPDMNGIEIVRQIRKEVGENAPIIILTAYDWADIEDEAREAGVTAFCSKPLFLSDLRRCLLNILHPQEEEPGEPVMREGLQGQRLLLVEDIDLNREIACEILSEACFIIEEAENGKIAVERLQEKGAGYYSLVLMDIQMPVMDGYTATRTIRALKDQELANIPIIAMTADAFEEDKKRALDAGMNAHISKPVEVSKLMSELEKILGGKE